VQKIVHKDSITIKRKKVTRPLKKIDYFTRTSLEQPIFILFLERNVKIKTPLNPFGRGAFHFVGWI